MQSLLDILAERLPVFLFFVWLLAGCSLAQREAAPDSPRRPAASDSKKSDAPQAAPEQRPGDSSPAERRRAAPSPIDRPVPVRPPPLPQGAAQPQLQPVQPRANIRSDMPIPVQVCDPGGCFGPDGSRYHGGVGDVYLDSSGRRCQRIGAWMQCS